MHSDSDTETETGGPVARFDRTLKQAETDARHEYEALAMLHIPTWSIDLFKGYVRYTCSCASPGPRNAAAYDSHILEAVRHVRGPLRGYGKK